MRPAVFSKSPRDVVSIRSAGSKDLSALNAVIERAVMGWRLPERVKRLGMSGYRYDLQDLNHMQIVVAEHASHGISGVAAWETAAVQDLPPGRSGALLHGIFVDPMRQHRGVGSQLLRKAIDAVGQQGMDGLLAKAQPDAVGFFSTQGMRLLEADPSANQYALRFWMDVRNID